MQDKRIVAFVGMPGAGKSSCVNFLEQKNLPSVYFGGITIDEVKARGLEVNERNEKFVREDIRAQEGKGAYAKRIVAQIDKLFTDGHDFVVVDGLYSWSEYKIFKEIWGDQALIVAIAAPRHVRHDRLANRPNRPLTKEEVVSREYAEIENLEKGGPIANADYTVVNTESAEELFGSIDKLLKELGITV